MSLGLVKFFCRPTYTMNIIHVLHMYSHMDMPVEKLQEKNNLKTKNSLTTTTLPSIKLAIVQLLMHYLIYLKKVYNVQREMSVTLHIINGQLWPHHPVSLVQILCIGLHHTWLFLSYANHY